jgi:hypothetical protein
VHAQCYGGAKGHCTIQRVGGERTTRGCKCGTSRQASGWTPMRGLAWSSAEVVEACFTPRVWAFGCWFGFVKTLQVNAATHLHNSLSLATV